MQTSSRPRLDGAASAGGAGAWSEASCFAWHATASLPEHRLISALKACRLRIRGRLRVRVKVRLRLTWVWAWERVRAGARLRLTLGVG